MDNVKADLDKAEARFTLQPGTKLDLGKVREAIKKAGYKPTWIAFAATGALVARDGAWSLEVKGSEQVLPLEENEALKKLRETVAAGRLVAVALKIPAGKDRGVVESFQVP